jgi:hypothetical protein
VPVAEVNVTPARLETPPTFNVPVSMVLPELDKKEPEIPASVEVPVTVVVAAETPDVTASCPATLAFPVVFKVATCKLPVPVAEVNVTPAKAEPPEMSKLPPLKKPDAVTLVEETLLSVEVPETRRVPTISNVLLGFVVPIPVLVAVVVA